MRVKAERVADLAEALASVRCCTFDLHSFRKQFAERGWLPCDAFEDHWYDFTVSMIPRFTLDIPARAAMAAVDWWEDGGHDGTRAEYDQRFVGYRREIEERLGKPMRPGISESDPRLSFAAWPGNDALIVLEQSDFDPQFGIQTLVIMQALMPDGRAPSLPIIW